MHLDATCDQLPKVDTILCRDCLQHLTYEHAKQVLLNFKKSSRNCKRTEDNGEHAKTPERVILSEKLPAWARTKVLGVNTSKYSLREMSIIL